MLSARPMALSEQFARAEKGDYLVAYISKAYTLLHIFDRTADTVTIEEVTVPSRHIDASTIKWQEWLKGGAQNNSSWVMYEIELSTGRMLEYYSFTLDGWAAGVDSDSFLSTLLHLELEPLRPEDRRKIGPPPLPGELDRRKLWHPPAYFKGEKMDGVAFGVWRATWPNDGSELSGKTIETYLPEAEGPYPTYFPYWIEVRGNVAKAKLRLKDTGIGMISPRDGLPLRPPQFAGRPRWVDGQLQFRLESPPYYSEFTLIACPVDGPWTATRDTNPTVTVEEDGTVVLSIPEASVSHWFEEGQRYRFTVNAKDHPRAADYLTWTFQR